MPAPDGPQWVDIYHASEDAGVTPHDRPHPHGEKVAPYRHDVVFGGTEESARHRVRGALNSGNAATLHHYRVKINDVSPVVYADDAWSSMKDASDVTASGSHKVAAKKGEVPGLWETIPVSPSQSRRSVLRYRNITEDPGSISYVMHKDMIKSGKIQYMGSRQISKENK